MRVFSKTKYMYYFKMSKINMTSIHKYRISGQCRLEARDCGWRAV